MASVNEYSARYSEVKDEFYLPELDRVQLQSKDNKQGSGDVINEVAAKEFREDCQGVTMSALDIYMFYNEFYIGANGRPTDEPNGEKLQVAKELNRINMPVSNYTEWYWKIDLHNLLRFLSLRSDSHAQKEIREYSDIILKQILPLWVPITAEAFEDYDLRRGGALFSKMELEIIKRLFHKDGAPSDLDLTEEFQRLGVSKRESDEFIKKIRS